MPAATGTGSGSGAAHAGPRSRTRGYVVDGAVAGAVFLYSLPLLRGAVPAGLPVATAVALSALTCASYLLSRRRPLLAYAVGAGTFGLQLVLGIGFLPAAVILLVNLYRVAVLRSRRLSAVVAVVTAGSVVVAALRWNDPYFGVPEIVSGIVVVATVWMWGSTIGIRRAYVAAVEERAAQLEREQDNVRRIVEATERARIARELHDVVSHGLSVVVVMAAGAAAQVRTDPDAAEQAMRTVERSGRTSLSEMRRMLDVLRDDEPGPTTRPQPGVVQLDQLVDQSRAAGLPVELTLSGDRPELEAGVDLTVYRIVQEALTNIRRHGGPTVTRVDVEVRFEPARLVVRVTDDGVGSVVDRPEATTGHGLVGMRERVGTCGGTLHVGPRAATGTAGSHGFEVVAHIPLESTR